MKLLSWYRKRKVLWKIFLPFFAITLLSSMLFTVYGFFQSVRAIENGIDKRLLIAAMTMPQLLPENYFDRVKTPDSISPDEHWANTKRLCTFLEHVGGTYLYALHQESNRYYFIASAATDTMYWAEYTNPAPNIYEIQKTWEPDPTTTPDPDYGLLRSVVMGHKDAAGRRFILGADIHAYEVEALKRRALLNFLIMGTASFLLAVLFSYFASTAITQPLTRLSTFTRRLVEGEFSSAIRVDPALFPDGNRTQAETAILAFDFDQMQSNLAEHIEQLKLTQSARERAESELRIAGQIQETFLPGPFAPTEFGGRVQLQAAMKTAKQAGGDLFDYFALDDAHLFFAIGDVSGKGMPAAMFMSAVVVLLRSAAKQWRDPAEILRRVNDDLAIRNESCTFVTLFAGILDVRTGEVVFANGGHNPPRLRSAAGAVAAVPAKTNMVVGALDGRTFARETLVLQPNETLVLYTDGVTEAFDENDQLYGEERFDRRLAALPAEASAAEILQGVVADVAAFSGSREQSDDITMLVLRYEPAGAQPS
ncbi:MAG: PP2C family protein-serine/threonine phosphatase [Kiritimatiellia bacterium]